MRLSDFSFEVRPGVLTIITGPSGSGKTTLINLLAALDRPNAGEIVVTEKNIATLPTREAARYRNKQVGVIFQFYNLLPQLTAIENVLMPTIPSRTYDRARAKSLLEEVELVHRSDHLPGELSGGEQQRVAIARALINDPAILLADEPTGNLDRENAKHVFQLLANVCRSTGKTLILVTHEPWQIPKPDQVLELQADPSVLRAVPMRYRLDLDLGTI